MGWSNMEDNINKKEMEKSSKILLIIIACLIAIIVLIVILLFNINKTQKQSVYTINVDGENITTVSKTNLLTKFNNITYINIEEFAKLVNYDYHSGEYKSYNTNENMCYVQGKEETTTFYVNEPKVYKLPINKLDEEYQVYKGKNFVRKAEDGKIYVPIDLASIAFNSKIVENEKSLIIYSLNYLTKKNNETVKKFGYTGILDQNFENQKLILYGFMIVKKENGLYKVIDSENKEIVSDKYTTIQFNEENKEFAVINNFGKKGIINLDGTIKIEPIYDEISIIDKKSEIYLIKKETKYGVVKNGKIIIEPEYDSIGLEHRKTLDDMVNKYFILDNLIPVCKDKKWGAFNKNGDLIYKLEYDDFGCDLTKIKINGTEKVVEPIIIIKKCNGVVVKKENKYGLLDIEGKELIPTLVDAIYALPNVEEEKIKYFMFYNENEFNIIERLILAGLIEDKKESNNITNTIQNNITINTTNVINTTNITFNNNNQNEVN